MIWDTFIFGGEGSDLDMLECRMAEFDSWGVTPAQVRHVLVEARYDHMGRPKPLYFQESRARFGPWLDRISHVVAKDVPGPDEKMHPWEREHIQRMAVWTALGGAWPDELVILADVDEIPSWAALTTQHTGMMAWDMRLAMFAVDWVYREPTRISVAGPKRMLGQLHQQRDNLYRSRLPLVENAGWHMTWLGGPEAIAEKAMKRSCHLELQELILSANAAGELYEQGHTWHNARNPEPPDYPPKTMSERLEAVDVDSTWPAYVHKGLCPRSWLRPR
jgi:hypothetical protein